MSELVKERDLKSVGSFPREFESHTDRSRYKTLLIYSNKKQLYSYNNSITIRTTGIDIGFNFGVSNTGIECLCVKVIYLCSLYRLFHAIGVVVTYFPSMEVPGVRFPDGVHL